MTGMIIHLDIENISSVNGLHKAANRKALFLSNRRRQRRRINFDECAVRLLPDTPALPALLKNANIYRRTLMAVPANGDIAKSLVRPNRISAGVYRRCIEHYATLIAAGKPFDQIFVHSASEPDPGDAISDQGP